MLRRYWLNFKASDRISPLALGCGVTASSKESAVELVTQEIFPIFGHREVDNIIEDVDISKLEKNHVLQNIGNPAAMGIWFPKL